MNQIKLTRLTSRLTTSSYQNTDQKNIKRLIIGVQKFILQLCQQIQKMVKSNLANLYFIDQHETYENSPSFNNIFIFWLPIFMVGYINLPNFLNVSNSSLQYVLDHLAHYWNWYDWKSNGPDILGPLLCTLPGYFT